MIFKPHKDGVHDVDSWYDYCPPKKGDKQWADGRSAKELARFMMKSFPAVPEELEKALLPLIPANSEFKWDAEKVTPLPGRGEGRNHDAVLYSENAVVTIEAKADEPLGNTIGKEMTGASENKLHRIAALRDIVFQKEIENFGDLRYQLLTACAGTLIEAETSKVQTAIALVVVFKTKGRVKPEKLAVNHADIENFLKATKAYRENEFWVIPNNTAVKLYFKELVI